MHTLDTKTKHFTQTTWYYCGAACSQMLLDRVGQNTSQDNLYEKIQDYNIESDAFYSDPNGISELLNSDDYDAFKNGDLYIHSTEDESILADLIFDTIFEQNVPAICLINDGNHWVVCHKLIFDLDENRMARLLGVFLLDPASSSTEVYIPIDQLIKSKITPNTFGEKWKGKRILVASKETKNRSNILIAKNTHVSKGGGSGEGSPDFNTVLSNVKSVGVPNAKLPLGGGSIRLEVLNIDAEIEYYIITLDALDDTNFKSGIYVAVDKKGSILEITRETNTNLYARDSFITQALQDNGFDGNYEIDPGLYWKTGGRLRNRFTLARKIVGSDNQISWIFPDGTISETLDTPQRGGGR